MKQIAVAMIRAAIGATGIVLAGYLPGGVASVASFCGHAFAFLAIYGLVLPLEMRITGGLADWLLRPSAPELPACCLSLDVEETMRMRGAA